MKRITILLLAAILLLTSCQGKPSDQETTTEVSDNVGDSQNTNQETPEEVQEVEDGYLAHLSKEDLGGQSFNIFCWANTLAISEEMNGEIVNDAVYERNLSLEELYNVDLIFDARPQAEADYPDWLAILTDSVQSGDDAFQLVCGYSYRLGADTILKGFAQNLGDISSLDFSNTWWDSDPVVKYGMINNKLFLCIGNVDPQFYGCSYVMYFNKRIGESSQITPSEMYNTVKEGKWTLDTMMKYASITSIDKNGDGTMTEGDDQFGYLTGWNMDVDSYLMSCDVTITQYDDKGLPYIPGISEKYFALQEKLQNFYKISNTALYSKGAKTNQFIEGQGFMLADMLKSTNTMRDMEDDFGILPYPKWDEAQSSYGTYSSSGNASAFVIPITTDGELSGKILNALSCIGYYNVRPQYIENAIKRRNSRDEDSIEMIDIVLKTAKEDFSVIYGSVFDLNGCLSPWNFLRSTYKADDFQLASKWAEYQGIIESTIAQVIEAVSG